MRDDLVRSGTGVEGKLSVQQWPEGPAADPEAARERYESGMRAERHALREVFRADLPAANTGLGVVVAACLIVGFLVGVRPGLLVAGAFAALFLATLAVMLLLGARGTDAVHRAYLFTFGWGNWI